jgi:hypothetical protein
MIAARVIEHQPVRDVTNDHGIHKPVCFKVNTLVAKLPISKTILGSKPLPAVPASLNLRI